MSSLFRPTRRVFLYFFFIELDLIISLVMEILSRRLHPRPFTSLPPPSYVNVAYHLVYYPHFVNSLSVRDPACICFLFYNSSNYRPRLITLLVPLQISIFSFIDSIFTFLKVDVSPLCLPVAAVSLYLLCILTLSPYCFRLMLFLQLWRLH